MHKLKQELVIRPLLHADETTLEVLCEPGRPAQADSYMWLYRTSGDAGRPIVLYDYQEGRSGRYAKKYLAGYSGYLHTDDWQGYQQLEEQGVTLCGCWVHARRKFHEARAGVHSDKADIPEAIGLAYYTQLFATEKCAETMTPEKRHAWRQKEERPIVEAFFDWVDSRSHTTLPQSLLGKALTYAQNQKKYLSVFLTDGRIELSNNRAERSIKPFVIGCKN